MRNLFFGLILLLLACTQAQTTSQDTASASFRASLTQALIRDWVGVLEYRDYSEPPTTTKRVQLPTWLHIANTASAMQWHYVYDDDPNKVVEETCSARSFVPVRLLA
jgi:hypothetical protein